MKCPKCQKEMDEVDGGPDTYDDDISFISDVCYECKIMLHGWFDLWYNDTDWHVSRSEGFETPEELLEYMDKYCM